MELQQRRSGKGTFRGVKAIVAGEESSSPAANEMTASAMEALSEVEHLNVTIATTMRDYLDQPELQTFLAYAHMVSSLFFAGGKSGGLASFVAAPKQQQQALLEPILFPVFEVVDGLSVGALIPAQRTAG